MMLARGGNEDEIGDRKRSHLEMTEEGHVEAAGRWREAGGNLGVYSRDYLYRCGQD